jgi:hypothetical protein
MEQISRFGIGDELDDFGGHGVIDFVVVGGLLRSKKNVEIR